MMTPNSAVLDSATADGPDPGSVDNRLSLDPSNPDWKEMIAKWKDGQEYKLELTVNQISPGEYEVTGVSAGSASENGEGEGSENEAEAETMPKKGRVNSSVMRMADEGA